MTAEKIEKAVHGFMKDAHASISNTIFAVVRKIDAAACMTDIPVLEGILVIPLIGKYNQERLSDLVENALIEISRQKANYLLIDVTSVTSVDEFTMFGIQKLIESVRLLGAECFIVGISSKLAIEITNTNLNMSEVRTFSTLQKGVEAVIGLNGFELVEKKKRKLISGK